mmetsp:Transcript_116973/g.376243  ORF Transcript_116973/g.376243 Transcript_116973/m.376243 type:complete len:238 (-) Transcript_116973:2538-3251(-)
MLEESSVREAAGPRVDTIAGLAAFCQTRDSYPVRPCLHPTFELLHSRSVLVEPMHVWNCVKDQPIDLVDNQNGLSCLLSIGLVSAHRAVSGSAVDVPSRRIDDPARRVGQAVLGLVSNRHRDAQRCEEVLHDRAVPLKQSVVINENMGLHALLGDEGGKHGDDPGFALPSSHLREHCLAGICVALLSRTDQERKHQQGGGLSMVRLKEDFHSAAHVLQLARHNLQHQLPILLCEFGF